MQHNARIFVLKLRCVTSCPLHVWACPRCMIGWSSFRSQQGWASRAALMRSVVWVVVHIPAHPAKLSVSCIQGFTLDLSPSKSPAPEASRIYTWDKCKLGRLVASWSHLCHQAMKFCLVGEFILPISIVLESRGAE
jgi:hypothetical protein